MPGRVVLFGLRELRACVSRDCSLLDVLTFDRDSVVATALPACSLPPAPPPLVRPAQSPTAHPVYFLRRLRSALAPTPQLVAATRTAKRIEFHRVLGRPGSSLRMAGSLCQLLSQRMRRIFIRLCVTLVGLHARTPTVTSAKLLISSPRSAPNSLEWSARVRGRTTRSRRSSNKSSYAATATRSRALRP